MKTDKPVTIERLERALAFCAYLVELDGEKAIPIFEKIEGELSAKRAQQGVAERARQLLHSLRNGAGSGALSAPNTIEHT